MNRFALSLLLTLAFTIGTSAQQVRFTVNMEHVYLAPGDRVVVRGDVPQLGNWGADDQLVLRQRGKSDTYAAQVRLSNVEQRTVLYKFVILRADGTEQWEEIGNRVLDTSSEAIPWFENRSTPGTTQPIVNVIFRLDLTNFGMDGYPVEGVALMGGQAPLSFDLENGRREMTQVQQGIWETSVGFPKGTPHDVAFKLAWQHEGEWIWEWRAGHTNHVFLIDDAGTEQTVSLVHDVEKPGIVPATGTSGHVDDYSHVLSTLGARAQGSRYQYELAMAQLEAGNRAGAEATYAAYAAAHPGEVEIDDFHYRLAHHINRTQGEAAANAFIARQRADETSPRRRAYFRYLEGELAYNNGNHAKARRLLAPLTGQADELVREYSRMVLVEAYLREADPDSIRRGVDLLEGYAAQAPQADARKMAVRLERAYRRADMPQKREEVLLQLTGMGNGRQQGRARLELAEVYTRQSRYSEVVKLLDATELNGQVPASHQARLMRLRMEAYYALDRDEEFADTYQRYQTEHPGDAHQRRLGRMNEQVRERRGSPPAAGMQTTQPDSTHNQEGQ